MNPRPAPTGGPAVSPVYPDQGISGKWASGLVLHNDDFAQLMSITNARGRKADVLTVALPAKSWSELTKPSPIQEQLGKTEERKAWIVPIVPADADAQAAVQGGYREEWTKFAQALKASGNESSIIRIDMSALADATPAQRVSAWRAAAAQIKAAAPQVLLEWDMPVGGSPRLWAAEFPGQTYVDIVGLSLTRTDTPWVQQLNAPGGVSAQAAWVQSRKEPFSVHWSLGDKGGAPGADAWVQNVHDFVARQAQNELLAYEVYDESRPAAQTLGAQTYRQLFR